MSVFSIGKVDYLNCFPIYYPIEQRIISLPIEIVKGPPALLNKAYLEGKLVTTPISSVEYARNADSSLILPNLSISAVGNVESILLFSKIPIDRLHQKNIALTSSSATSIVLLKILMKKMYQQEPNYQTMHPNLEQMMENAEAALLIGDDALGSVRKGSGYYIYDLGQLWYQLTDLPMVYAVWVISKEMVQNNKYEAQILNEGFRDAKEWQKNNAELLLQKAEEIYEYSPEILKSYFNTIKYDFSDPYRQGLIKFYEYAEEIGEIPQKVDLNVWG